MRIRNENVQSEKPTPKPKPKPKPKPQTVLEYPIPKPVHSTPSPPAASLLVSTRTNLRDKSKHDVEQLRVKLDGDGLHEEVEVSEVVNGLVQLDDHIRGHKMLWRPGAFCFLVFAEVAVLVQQHWVHHALNHGVDLEGVDVAFDCEPIVTSDLDNCLEVTQVDIPRDVKGGREGETAGAFEMTNKTTNTVQPTQHNTTQHNTTHGTAQHQSDHGSSSFRLPCQCQCQCQCHLIPNKCHSQLPKIFAAPIQNKLLLVFVRGRGVSTCMQCVFVNQYILFASSSNACDAICMSNDLHTKTHMVTYRSSHACGLPSADRSALKLTPSPFNRTSTRMDGASFVFGSSSVLHSLCTSATTLRYASGFCSSRAIDCCCCDSN